MMRFQLDDLHAVALNAFDEMEDLAVKAESDTTAYNERQFVFQLGSLLTRGAITQGAHLWTGFEYRYPDSAGTQKRTKCDLAVWERNSQGEEAMGWLEVKSTGLDDYGNWDNGFGSLRWREDFDKLKGIEEQIWSANHTRAWVWLYQFENYRDKVDAAYGSNNKWSPPKQPSDYLSMFGRAHEGNVNLPRVLAEITSDSSSALMSLRPRVQTHDSKRVLSALILTAIVAAASHPASENGA